MFVKGITEGGCKHKQNGRSYDKSPFFHLFSPRVRQHYYCRTVYSILPY
jgi:hypothetical protein